MKRDSKINKFLLRSKPDEIYPHIVRKNGKLVTVRKFEIFYSVFGGKTHYFAYYKGNKAITTGKICKSEVFEALRKLAVQN